MSFDTNLEANEDYDFLFRSAIHNFNFIPNLNTIAIYRCHDNNSSKKLNWNNSCYIITKKFDYLIERHIKFFKLTNIYGYSIFYIIFSCSIIGYALKFINESPKKADFLLDISIKYLLNSLSHNDINITYFDVINLYMCLLRNLANYFLYYKPLHKILDRFRDILPQCFDYEASSKKLKQLSNINYIPHNIIMSIFNSGITKISPLL